MKTYYVTFGQKSPFRDGWVEILAKNKEDAQKHANYVFGDKFSMLYDELHMNPMFFPAGRIGHILKA